MMAFHCLFASVLLIANVTGSSNNTLPSPKQFNRVSHLQRDMIIDTPIQESPLRPSVDSVDPPCSIGESPAPNRDRCSWDPHAVSMSFKSLSPPERMSHFTSDPGSRESLRSEQSPQPRHAGLFDSLLTI